MSELMNTLLRWGIIASLSDREAFVQKVSGIFEQYRKDPEESEKLAKLLAAYLKDAKGNINAKKMIRKFIAEGKVATRRDIDELHNTLRELVREFHELNKKENV